MGIARTIKVCVIVQKEYKSQAGETMFTECCLRHLYSPNVSAIKIQAN